jgi:hypothetical protein
MPSNYNRDYGLGIQGSLLQELSRSAADLEELSSAVYSYLDIDNYKDFLFSQQIKVSPLLQLEVGFFDDIKKEIELSSLELNESKSKILEEYSLLSEKEKMEKNFLNRLTSRIEQKIAYLNNFGNNIKVLFYEFFNSIENIDKTKKDSLLNVSPEASVMTLPITDRAKSLIKNVTLLTGSNGVPGDVFTGENKLIQRMLENSERIFQYTKLDSGPLKLVLEFELFSQSPINEIIIKRNSQFANNDLAIDNVYYKDSNENKVSLLKLINTDKQTLKCNSYRQDEGINILHLPAKAKRIELHLSSNEYVIKNNRRLYSIDIKNIEFASNKFASQGKIYFKEQAIPGELSAYSVNLSESIHPAASDISKEIIKKIKFDNSGYQDCSNSKLILDEEKESYAIYYELKRTNNLSNIITKEDNKKIVTTQATQKRFSRSFSPNQFSLEYNESGLKVYQPKVYSRTKNIRNATNIGTVNQGLNKIILPINLNDAGIDFRNLEIYIRGVEVFQYTTRADLLADENKTACHVSPGGESVLVYSLLTSSTPVKAKLKLVDHKIVNEDNSIFIEIEQDFDPTKQNIKITHKDTTESSTDAQYPLPNDSGKNYFLLTVPNIDLNSIQITFVKDGTLIEPSRYQVEEVGGSIHIVEVVLGVFEVGERYTINYTFTPEIDDDFKDFEFWIDETEKIKGLHISKDYIALSEKTDSIPAGRTLMNLSLNSLIKNSLSFVTEPFGETTLLEEVDYWNGSYEFLNLNLIEKEILPSIQSSNGTVRFTTHKIPYVQDGFKIKVYKNGAPIIPDCAYNISDGRIVELSITDETSLGYSIQYFYQKEISEAKRYSVDYKNGRVFFSEATTSASEVNFKYIDIDIEYNIIKYINDFSAENDEIEMGVEEFTEANELVKFLWFEANDSFNIEDLEEYYSPIIYDIKMEMS